MPNAFRGLYGALFTAGKIPRSTNPNPDSTLADAGALGRGAAELRREDHELLANLLTTGRMELRWEEFGDDENDRQEVRNVREASASSQRVARRYVDMCNCRHQIPSAIPTNRCFAHSYGDVWFLAAVSPFLFEGVGENDIVHQLIPHAKLISSGKSSSFNYRDRPADRVTTMEKLARRAYRFESLVVRRFNRTITWDDYRVLRRAAGFFNLFEDPQGVPITYANYLWIPLRRFPPALPILYHQVTRVPEGLFIPPLLTARYFAVRDTEIRSHNVSVRSEADRRTLTRIDRMASVELAWDLIHCWALERYWNRGVPVLPRGLLDLVRVALVEGFEANPDLDAVLQEFPWATSTQAYVGLKAAASPNVEKLSIRQKWCTNSTSCAAVERRNLDDSAVWSVVSDIGQNTLTRSGVVMPAAPEDESGGVPFPPPPPPPPPPPHPLTGTAAGAGRQTSPAKEPSAFAVAPSRTTERAGSQGNSSSRTRGSPRTRGATAAASSALTVERSAGSTQVTRTTTVTAGAGPSSGPGGPSSRTYALPPVARAGPSGMTATAYGAGGAAASTTGDTAPVIPGSGYGMRGNVRMVHSTMANLPSVPRRSTGAGDSTPMAVVNIPRSVPIPQAGLGARAGTSSGVAVPVGNVFPTVNEQGNGVRQASNTNNAPSISVNIGAEAPAPNGGSVDPARFDEAMNAHVGLDRILSEFPGLRGGIRPVIRQGKWFTSLQEVLLAVSGWSRDVDPEQRERGQRGERGGGRVAVRVMELQNQRIELQGQHQRSREDVHDRRARLQSAEARALEYESYYASQDPYRRDSGAGARQGFDADQARGSQYPHEDRGYDRQHNGDAYQPRGSDQHATGSSAWHDNREIQRYASRSPPRRSPRPGNCRSRDDRNYRRDDNNGVRRDGGDRRSDDSGDDRIRRRTRRD